MALDTNIVGSNLDAGGNVKTALTLNPTYMGGALMFSENDPGDVTGTPFIRSPETSHDYRLRVGLDSIWDEDVFNYTQQNFNKHKYTTATMTNTWAGGFLNTNGSSTLTATHGTLFQTYRHFPMQGGGGMYCEISVAFSNTPVTNTNIDFGIFLPGAAVTVIPLDGVYFRVNSSGVSGVVNNNGTEETVLLNFTYLPNTVYKFVIAVSPDEVEFWINDVLYGDLAKAAGAGSSMFCPSNPFAIRHHNTGVPSGVISAKISNYTIGFADMDNVRLWASNKSGQGLSSLMYPSGTISGQTAINANGSIAAASTLTATAPATNNLGGSFFFNSIAGSETDYPIFAFLNPVPSTTVTGRNLVIRGIWVDTWSQGAAAGANPTIMQWSVAVGSTAVLLATTDGASTRLPKRSHLGVQVFAGAAPIGTLATKLDCNFDAPVVVEPGTYLHIILRMPSGTLTASHTFRGAVGINGYWE